MAFRQLRNPTTAGNYVKWDTPKTVKGRLVGFTHKKFKGQDTTSIILRQDDGVEIRVNGSANIENAGLYNEQPGVVVELVFKGKGTTKAGATYNDIDVFVDSPEPEPRSTTAAAKAAPTITENGDYDVMVAKLQLANPKGAAAVVTALEGLAPDPAVRTEKLRAFLKESGIA
jgi:hypothetical protein